MLDGSKGLSKIQNSNVNNVKDFLCSSSYFRIISITNLFLFSVVLLDRVSFIITIITTLWGLFILCRNFIMNKKFKEINSYKIISLFLISGVITIFIHMNHHFVENGAILVNSALCFFVFYGMCVESSFEKIKREITIVAKLIIFITTFLSIISLIVLFVLVNFKLFGYPIGLELESGRLYGVYSNANLLGFSSVTAIVFATIIWHKKRTDSIGCVMSKCLLSSSIVLNFITLLLCDSNNSLLFLSIYIIVLLCFQFLSGIKKLKLNKKFVQILMLLLSTIGSFTFLFLAREGCQYVATEIINEIIKVKDIKEIDFKKAYAEKKPLVSLASFKNNRVNYKYSSNTLKLSTNNCDIKVNEDSDDNILVGRVFGSKYYPNVSSGRIDLIKQGFEIFIHYPILGIGRYNLEYYGNIYFKNGIRFPDLHNGYLTILVSSGIIGFMLFAAFLFKTLKYIGRYVFLECNKTESGVAQKLFAAIIAYLVYSFGEKTILSEITYMVIFFWMTLGYLVTYVYNDSLKKSLE